MFIEKEIELKKSDSMKFMLINIFSLISYFYIGLIAFTVLLTIEGMIFRFTLLHNIFYFFASMGIVLIVILVVAAPMQD